MALVIVPWLLAVSGPLTVPLVLLVNALGSLAYHRYVYRR